MEECIFCQISQNKKEAVFVYKDDLVIAFMDHRPINKGHVLVLPSTHYRDIYEVPTDVLSEVSMVTKELAIAVNNAFNPLGINIIQNNGIDAGQTVFHFHVHLIPRYDSRYNEELAKVAWRRKVSSIEELIEAKDEIIRNLRIRQNP